ncbi:MAG: HtaA domain-containing protein [Patulibacter sp.]|nr:HtaA domain-containing protein [Patulibacter sp.]
MPVSRTRSLAGLLAAAATAVAFAMPATSQATVPSPVTSATWTLKTSWVDYLTNPLLSFGLGNVTPVGPGAPTGTGATAANFPYPHYAYVWSPTSDTTSGGVRTVQFSGGIDFDQPLHDIDISISDVRVEDDGSTERLRVDATYKPFMGSPVTLSDVVFGEIDPSTQVITLEDDGAEIFNGGTTQRSYKTGDAFGSITFP